MRKLIALAVLFVIYSANAQKSDEKLVYSLQSCIETALEKNFDIRLKDYQLDAANADMKQAFGSYLPSLGFNFGYNRTLNPTLQPYFSNGELSFVTYPDSYSMSLNASLPLFDGFAREANFKRTKTALKSLDLRTKFTIEYVKQDIYSKYLDVIRNGQIVKINKENFTRGQKDLEKIKAQFDAGVIAKTFVYSQEADQGNLESAIVRSENNYNISKAALMSVMGINPDMSAEFLESSIPSEISDKEIGDFKSKVGSMNSAITKSLKIRNDYIAAGLTLEAQQTLIESASAAYYPTVTAQGGWAWNNVAFNNFGGEKGKSSIGVNLSIPIFDNFTTNNRIESAKLQVAQSEYEKLTLEQNIRTQVQTAYINVIAAEKQMEIAKKTLLAAKMNFDSFQEMFNVGSVSVTDFTTANARYITAQIDNVNYVYQYLKARKELLYSTGIYE